METKPIVLITKEATKDSLICRVFPTIHSLFPQIQV